MEETIKTTIVVSRVLWKEVQKRCIDLDINTTKALESALAAWIEKTAIQEKPTARRASGKSG